MHAGKPRATSHSFLFQYHVITYMSRQQLGYWQQNNSIHYLKGVYWELQFITSKVVINAIFDQHNCSLLLHSFRNPHFLSKFLVSTFGSNRHYRSCQHSEGANIVLAILIAQQKSHLSPTCRVGFLSKTGTKVSQYFLIWHCFHVFINCKLYSFIVNRWDIVSERWLYPRCVEFKLFSLCPIRCILEVSVKKDLKSLLNHSRGLGIRPPEYAPH